MARGGVVQVEELDRIFPTAVELSDWEMTLAYAGLELKDWDERLALFIRLGTSPAPLALIAVLLAGLASHDPSAWIWAAFYLITVVLIPGFYLLWKVRMGEFSDYFLHERGERLRLLALVLCLGGWSWLVFLACSAPFYLTALAGGWTLLTACLLLLTLRWKISLSGAYAAGLVVFAGYLAGSPVLPAVLIVPLLAWSRARLERSRAALAAGGVLTGQLVGALLFRLLFG